ncbi:hypothetical protein DH2020_049947 [Rehmannia glutinosa]|uniref:RRP15-like protein n=1 Tax=Rehmannia glutinosa TaxID=99300 RepID=A0ABR0U2I4_REHGL
MAKKRQRTMRQGAENRVKVDKKMKKLFQKRARDYKSDDEEEEEPLQEPGRAIGVNSFKKNDDQFEREFSDIGEEENEGSEAEEVSDDENSMIQPGVTKFTEGIKAFKLAFKKIVKKSGGDEDVLGPVLSAHKKLIAEKLAEEETEKKVKGEVKKEKHLVNKAQNAQKGLNPSRSKDEKGMPLALNILFQTSAKRRKEAFFSELGKTPSQSVGTSVKVGTSIGSADGEAPAWAPLRDSYMLTNPKLKDWDKMQDTNTADDFRRHSDSDSSSDDD